MLWISVAVIAYTLLALAALVDKLVVTEYLSSPRVYMFLASVLGAIIVVAAPFALHWPGWDQLPLNIASGAFFSAALFFFYVALTRGDASRVVAGVDGLMPVATLLLAMAFLRERLTLPQLAAFALLVGGTMALAHTETKTNAFLQWSARIWKRKGRAEGWMVLAALAFGASFFLAKVVYETQPFVSGLIWIRVGGAAVALPLLAYPPFRDELKKNFHKGRRAQANTKMVLLGQGTGAAGVFLQHYAIALGSVVLTTVLQGLKYIFLFFFITLVGKKYKRVREHVQGKILRKKIAAFVLIVAGLALLSVS